MIVALVLAAGRSERMGRPKALLPLHGGTFLEAILGTIAGSRVDDVKVVLGHGSDEILRRVALSDDRAVTNADWPLGMLSSIRAGLRALPPEAEAFLLWPVDHPLASRETIDLLVAAFRAGAGRIVAPRYAGRRGHPVLFDARLAGEMVAAPDAVGAKAVVHAHEDEVATLDVDDPGVTTDIDTRAAYEAALGRIPG